MAARFAQTPSIMTRMVIEHFHGAVTRVSPAATAFPHRKPGCNLVIPGVWPARVLSTPPGPESGDGEIR